MNKATLIMFLIFISGCQIKLFSPSPNIETNTVNIQAKVFSKDTSLISSKLNTKIQIQKDSISVRFYPFLGIEMAKLLITNDAVYFSRKFQGTIDTIRMKDMDPKMNVKKLKKAIVKTSFRKDTVFYRNSYFDIKMTNYTPHQAILLPEKIIFRNTRLNNSQNNPQIFDISYNSVQIVNQP